MMDAPTFRTLQPVRRSPRPIGRDEGIVLLGSCFSDSVGARLMRDGFRASVNAMGALYNPLSIAGAVSRALEHKPYIVADLTVVDGTAHCLDFESHRQGNDPTALLERLNVDFGRFADTLDEASTVILTFGTAWVFGLAGTQRVVGNCHKLPQTMFERRRITVDEIAEVWRPLLDRLAPRRVILTVSPVRHLADSLHGNQLSKATLLLAVERLCGECGAEYFPSYEIALDDLRDYRFYAADLKHLSDTAVDYIYDIFCETYFTPGTMRLAAESRRSALRAAHRPILKENDNANLC